MKDNENLTPDEIEKKKEERREYKRKWYKKNKEAIQSRQKEYRNHNKEKIKKYQKEWRRKRKAEVQAASLQNCARKAAEAEEIGERIQKIRKGKKLTQKELAEIMGTTHCSVSHWEEGRRYMNIYYLIRLCEALEVSSDYLLFGKEHEE